MLRQNQFGFTASGPVIKNKIVLFGSYQGTRQEDALDPTNHKFRSAPAANELPFDCRAGRGFAGDYGYLRPAFGTIAANDSNIAPQALALLQAKLPNGQYVILTPQTINKSKALEVLGSSFLSSPGFFNEDQFMVNGDYIRSDSNKFRYAVSTRSAIRSRPPCSVRSDPLSSPPSALT